MYLKGRVWGWLLLLLAYVPAGWSAPVVQVVGPDPVAAEVVALLAARTSSASPALEVSRDAGSPALVVAVGARAFQQALDEAKGVTPVVGIALTRHSYRTVTSGRAGRYTAVFWEPDPVQQLRLARHLLPGARSVGVLLGTAAPALLANLQREAGRQRLTLVSATLAPGELLTRRLNTLLEDSDFLLAVEDPAVFSPTAAKTTLLTSYRHGKPVVGPGSAYVDAGSIASLAVTMPDVIDTLAAWLPALLARQDDLPPPRYAAASAIKTNPQVARSLRLSLPPPGRLPALLDEITGGAP